MIRELNCDHGQPADVDHLNYVNICMCYNLCTVLCDFVSDQVILIRWLGQYFHRNCGFQDNCRRVLNMTPQVNEQNVN